MSTEFVVNIFTSLGIHVPSNDQKIVFRDATNKVKEGVEVCLIASIHRAVTDDHCARVAIDHHHHHVVPLAQISLTLSCHFSVSFIASGRSSGLHPIS